MKISELYTRCFARGNDLKDPATVTIKEITQEELYPDGRAVEKFVLWFTETPRSVILT